MHLVLFDRAIAIFIDLNEGLFELRFIIVVGRWNVLKHNLQEALRLWPVQFTASISVKLFPDLIDSLCVDTVFLILCVNLPFKSSVDLEDGIINKHLDVAWEAFPGD